MSRKVSGVDSLQDASDWKETWFCTSYGFGQPNHFLRLISTESEIYSYIGARKKNFYHKNKNSKNKMYREKIYTERLLINAHYSRNVNLHEKKKKKKWVERQQHISDWKNKVFHKLRFRQQNYVLRLISTELHTPGKIFLHRSREKNIFIVRIRFLIL